ncbi:MAG: alpha-2-macroglobulin family protein [bacterium]|nr:alpha-2-macroglobulin family protein [bacterium]
MDPVPNRISTEPVLHPDVAPIGTPQHHYRWKKVVIFGIVLILFLAGILAKSILGGTSFSTPKTNYVPVYTLVNEKISEHGAIIINLPKGVSQKGAETKVSFDPGIAGEWIESDLPNAVVYKPAAALALGKHYNVALATDAGAIKKDFLVDEDPRVVSVFPDSNAEAELASAITVVFNRPMVPLTTLSELDKKDVPVSVSPATPGKFKWISTRTLQFIPSATLYGSSHYTVTVNPGFISMDGISVAPKTFSFRTKQLRLNSSTSGTIVYNEPINFYFNQPVDIQKTSGEIKVINNATNAQIEFVASYGTSYIWDANNNSEREVQDKSIVSILPKNSKNGHSNVWDFSTPYTATIKTAYPIGGDIALTGNVPPLTVGAPPGSIGFAPLVPGGRYPYPVPQSFNNPGMVPPQLPSVFPGNSGGSAAIATVTTSPVLKSVTVLSENTTLASPQLFDPTGTTTFSFYEDIDKEKSGINAKGLKNIEYGEKCEEENSEGYYSKSCKKVKDKSQLIFTFDASVYASGEKVPVTFERLINAGGYQVNTEPIVTELTVYPQLRITSTTPANNTDGASVKDLILCTNTPLKELDGKKFHAAFKANKYMVFGRKDNPYLQTNNYWEKPRPCAIGDYVNRIHYGLHPEQAYAINASIEDVFGQKANTQLSFTTGKAPKFYLRFQSLQKIYNVTTPERTKLTYATENFDYVDLSICKVSADSMVRILAAQPSDTSTASNGSLPCLISQYKQIPLKPDQWVNQYFQIDLKDYFPDPRGQFILSYSHPQYVNREGLPLYARTYLSVTNLAVVEKRVKWSSYDNLPDVPSTVDPATRGSVYWVSRMHSMEPENAASVNVYKSGGADRWGNNNTTVPPILALSGATNASGFGEFPLIADVVGAAVMSGPSTGADANSVGQESAVVSTWVDTISNNSWRNAYQNEKMYVYTDRPIYRPGQEVFIKGLYRLDFDGVFEVFRDADVKLQVTNSKGEIILTQKLPVSSYGTISTSVNLPADAPLGSYSINAGGSGYAFFDVAEYVGAAFEAKAETDKEEYIAGDTVNFKISGKYYFGVPLDGGLLDYSLTSQNFYFDRYTDEYFNFGGNWYSCYDCGYGDTYLKSGKVQLDAEGRASIAQQLDFDDLFTDDAREQSKIFVLHGTIKDKQGKSVSFQKSFIVHRGDFYMGVKADPSFTGTNQPVVIRAKTVDVEGKPKSKSGITVVVNKVTWDSNKRQEVDGGYYNRAEQVLTPVITKSFSTNGSGDDSAEIKLKDPGQYAIVATAKDGKDNEIKGTSEIYVYGEGTVDVRPTNNATLELKAEKKDLKVGERAKLIIQSPYPRAKALISIERGRIFTYEVVNIERNMYEYEFPITEDYAPNVFASVVLLSSGPEVKYGQIEFTVDRKAKELTIDIKPGKLSYLPGEKVTLNVTTKDAKGNPVPANVSLAVADLSVLALKGNPKKDPLLFFYDGLPLTVTTETNVKNLLQEAEIPTGTKGGDGGNPADLATRKRGEFRDTAFWQADVVTNAQGMATVTFTLPDNLTRWQVESVGITKDTKLGVRYQEITAQKGVMTIPQKPRFIVPGDEFMIGAKIFNQTLNSQTLEISLESKTLELLDARKTKKTIQAGATEAIYFKVKAPENFTDGIHAFILSAKNNDYNDTVEQNISITRNTTYESTATANSTSALNESGYLFLPDGVLKDRGGLTIKTSATLAVYLSDALQYLFSYPYGCSEQLASRLSSMAITKKALAIPNVSTQFKFPTVTFNGTEYTVDQAVNKGLAQLYDSQTVDGGFSYYKGLQADPYLSMHVLNTLIDIEKAGYNVRQDVISRAVTYLYGQVLYVNNPQNTIANDTDTLIFAAYALSRADGVSASFSALMNKIVGRATVQYLSDSAGSQALGYLALVAARGGTSESFKNTVFSTLINKVDIDSRGAYVKQNVKNISWRYYETAEKDTALFLKALVADKREYSQTANILRWLLASRAKDGSWGSTNTSVAVIDAMSDYLSWKRETESEFTLATTLDGGAVNSTKFDKKNILSTIETFLPISKISAGINHVLAFTITNNNSLPNTFYYDLSLKYYLPVQQIAPRDEGVAITREFYSLTDKLNARPLQRSKVGDVVRGVLTIISAKPRNMFAIEDYIPAGFELVDFNLATEDQSSIDAGSGAPPSERRSPYGAGLQTKSLASSFWSWKGIRGLFSKSPVVEVSGSPTVYQKFNPEFKEMHDDRLFLFSQNVPAGAYTYEYYIRATTPGTFSHLPAIASDLYFPENFGRTAGSVFTVLQ